MVNRKKLGFGIEDLLLPKREAILKLVAEHGGSNVRVFGSVARGEARENSDIDLLTHLTQQDTANTNV
jgi:predicted nucleotidyltransferase